MSNIQTRLLTYHPAVSQYARFPLRPLPVHTRSALANQRGTASVKLPLIAPIYAFPKNNTKLVTPAKGRYGFVDVVAAVIGPAPSIDYVLPGLVAGAIAVLAGPGGVSKSHFCVGLGLALSLHMPICGGVLPAASGARRVLIIQAENDLPMLALRVRAWIEHIFKNLAVQREYRTIEKLAIEVSKNFQMCAVPGHTAFLLDSYGRPGKMLRKLMRLTIGFHLVVVDPLRRFSRGNENDSDVMTQLVCQLENISRTNGNSFLVAHHVSKTSSLEGGLAQQAVRGSSALTDAVRCQFNMAPMTTRDPESRLIKGDEMNSYVRFANSKANHASLLAPTWMKRLPGGVLERADFASQRKSELTGGPKVTSQKSGRLRDQMPTIEEMTGRDIDE